MPTVELDIRQLADEGGTAPIAPITVTDAVLDENGDTLTDTLDEIKSDLTSFTIRTVSIPYTVASNSSFYTNLKTIIDADLPSGYVCLGIVGFTTNDVAVLVMGVYYASTNYSFQVANTASRSITNTAYVRYLCAKI